MDTHTTTRRSNMPRTDVHAPRHMDPAEYTLLLEADTRGEGNCTWYEVESNDPRLNAPAFKGHWHERGGCDHCGAHGLRFIAVYHHAPSNETVVVGWQCASILGLDSKSEREHRDRQVQARRLEAVREWVAASPENGRCHEVLLANAAASQAWGDRNEAAYDTGSSANHFGFARPNSFLSDLLHKLNRYGSLSERQVAAALRSVERDAEFAARRAAQAAEVADAGPLVEGRRHIAGVIVSLKTQQSDYGTQFKMLVREDDGNKVWGTEPASISGCEKGQRVELTATVTRSDRDEHFGFFSRPSKAIIIDEEAS